MRALVCLTGIVDPEERLEFVPGHGATKIEALRRTMNPADACALEQALRLKDRDPDMPVVALTMGANASDDVLREALGQGADTALRFWHDALDGADAAETAQALAATARMRQADLVLCGERAADGDTGQVPVRVAAILGWPFVAGVIRLEVTADGEAIAEQRLERGLRQRVCCKLPAVITVAAGANRPRYPRLRNRLRAKNAPVTVWGESELSINASETGTAPARTTVLRVSPPKPTSKGIFTPDAELSPEERLAQILSGGIDQRSAADQPKGPLTGSPEQQAKKIARFLVDGKFL